MKYAKYLFSALAMLLITACTQDKSTSVKVSRTLLLQDEVGLYRESQPLLLFDRDEHHLVVIPSQGVYAIEEDSGKGFVRLQIDRLPTDAKTPVEGTLTDNMGFDIGCVELYLVGEDATQLWLWSEKARVGFIFPKTNL